MEGVIKLARQVCLAPPDPGNPLNTRFASTSMIQVSPKERTSSPGSSPFTETLLQRSRSHTTPHEEAHMRQS